jgi:hypothetical protein
VENVMTLLVWMMILLPAALASAEALSARIDRLAECELRRRAAAADAKTVARLLRHAATRRRMAWRVAIADMTGELGFATFWVARQVRWPDAVVYGAATVVLVALVLVVLMRGASRQLSLEQIDSLIARYDRSHYDVALHPRRTYRPGPGELARLAVRHCQVALMRRTARRRRAARTNRRLSVHVPNDR